MTREEALKEFVGYQTYDIQPSVEATKLAVEALKGPRWIPVSDKLPETNGRFLTQIVNPYEVQCSYIMICDYIGKSWCPDDETSSSNVVAWMPLPEQYEAESEVEK